MAGHSKWASIKRQKAVTDAKRGAIFTKHAKTIAVAAKNGKDPEMNPALRAAIDRAKAANMPKDNIEKAILKGAGELPGVVYEEVRYEGYGPGGVALVIECVTDNTNRTVSFVRSTLTKAGGSLGSNGSVMFLFAQKGVIRLTNDDLGSTDRDALELASIDAGAEDIAVEEEGISITTERNDFHTVLAAVQELGATPSDSGIEWIATAPATTTPSDVEKTLALIETLEENDDVSAVYSNLEG